MTTGCPAATSHGWLLAGVTLAIASAFDVRCRRIPNWLTAVALVAGLVFAFLQGTLHCSVLAMLLSVLVVGSPNLIRSGAVGAGDCKLAGVVGSLVGATGTLLTVGIAAIWASVYLFFAGWLRLTRNSQPSLPLAPFLLVGFLLSFCFELLAY